MTLSIIGPGGLLINHGTVAVSNYATFLTSSIAALNNTDGAVRNACRGNAPFDGITGVPVVQDACFWDGGGETNNWFEAANWDSDTVPTPDELVLIGNGAGAETVVELDSSLNLNWQGAVTIGAGQTLNVGEGVTLRIANQPPGGSVEIFGTLNLNGGTLHSDSTGLINNHGTINGGTLDNQGDFLVNKSGGTINNVGGLFSNGAGTAFTNEGTVVNGADSTFLHGNDVTFVNSGTFTNAGTFYTASRGGDVTNWKGGSLVNSGIWNQGGIGIFSNVAGSTITNSGQINLTNSLLDNRGTITNTGTLEVLHFGSYQNLQGTLENQAGGTFSNSGSVTNFSGSTINNAGSIVNDRTLLNAGVLNNACGGTVTGLVSGIQPVSTKLTGILP